MLINTQIASHLGVGAVSWLTYADRLMEFPTALLGVALGVVLLPQLSAARGQADAERFSGLLDWGLRLVLLLALPCAVALLVFPQALVAVLFHYGAFEARDVQMTVQALMGYGVGLMGLIGAEDPGARLLRARGRADADEGGHRRPCCSRRPLNLVLVPWLGHGGLALSIGLAALFNAGVLLFLLRRRGLYRPSPGWAGFALRVVAACAVLGALLAFAARRLDWIALQAHWAQRAGWMALVLGGVALVYFVQLHLSGLKLRQFVRRA